jgi:hypothetical protein
MKRATSLPTLAASLLLTCLPLGAQERGAWRAASNTAQSITGDVALSDEKISINFSTFPMVKVRALNKGEISATFDADSNADGSGSLYRLDIPASKKFLRRNSLCGAEDTLWMVTYVTGRSLRLAFFSGQKVPVFTLDAISNSTDLCGTFSYAK